MSATALLRAERRARREDEIRKAHPGQHLPLHRLREHRRGDQGGGAVTRDDRDSPSAARRRARRDEGRLRRPERPAQGGQAARPGRGRLLRRRQAARDGLRPLRPLAVRAREDQVDRRLEGARARRRLRDAHRRRGRDPHRPVLRAVGAARARTSRTTRSPSARVRHVGEPVAAVVARDARARARRGRAGRGRVRAAAAVARRRGRAEGRGRSSTTTRARTSSGRASSTGATSTARSPRPTTS